MVTVSDVLTALVRRVPPSSAAAWDQAGLQLGDPEGDVATVAVCHEVTESVVAEVEARSPDVLITYHPLLFRPVTRLVAGSTPAGRAMRLLRAGTALAVAHTAFDVAEGGMSDALADTIGLVDVRPFGAVGVASQSKVVVFVPGDSVEAVTGAMTAAGAGRIGNYSGCQFRTEGAGLFHAEEGSAPVVGSAGDNSVDEVRVEMVVDPSRLDSVVAAVVHTHPYEQPAFDVYDVSANYGFAGRVGSFSGTVGDLAERAERLLGGVGLRVSGDRKAVADQVAVLPGSGSSFLPAARAAGARAFVTGDVDHHRVVEAVDAGMAVVDPGHGPTERPGMSALVRMVGSCGLDVEVDDLTGHDPTPWR